MKLHDRNPSPKSPERFITSPKFAPVCLGFRAGILRIGRARERKRGHSYVGASMCDQFEGGHKWKAGKLHW